MRTHRNLWPLGAALSLTLFGFWLPWLAPDPVGLNLNGFELSDWVMLSPDVLYRAYPLNRLSYLGVTACLTIGFGVALGQARVGRNWRSWIAQPATWALAFGLLAAFLTTLPYFPHSLTGWREPEWRLQWLAALGALAGGLLGVIVPIGLGRLALVGLALGGAHLAFWSWWLTRPLAEMLLGSAPTGLGWVLCLAGWAGVLVVGLFDVGRR